MFGFCVVLFVMMIKEFYENYLWVVDFIYIKKERVESLVLVGFEFYNVFVKVKFDVNGDIMDLIYDVYNFNDYFGSMLFKFRRVSINILYYIFSLFGLKV